MDTVRKGFTLVELLVVISIVALLSSVVVASTNNARQKSRDARRISDIKQIRIALELYYDVNGQYPAAIGGPSGSVLVSGGYLPAIPTDPSVTPACTTGTQAGCYRYAGLGDVPDDPICRSYHLMATLENFSNPALANDIDAGYNPNQCATSRVDQTGNLDSTYGRYDFTP
jgi:prepilin-type N-terminal cleavage/methylation domain-containing protein